MSVNRRKDNSSSHIFCWFWFTPISKEKCSLIAIWNFFRLEHDKSSCGIRNLIDISFFFQASQQQIEQRLAEKLKAPQNAQLSINSSNFKDLSDKLDKEKLAAIRAKIIAQRRTRIKGAEDEDGKATSLGGFLDSSERIGSSVFRNEKQWRTRTTILQSTGKTFSKSISAILSSVKARLVILLNVLKFLRYLWLIHNRLKKLFDIRKFKVTNDACIGKKSYYSSFIMRNC